MNALATLPELLRESLREMLQAAKMCIKYQKISPPWDKKWENGRLGVAASVLLLSIADQIGSYLRGTSVPYVSVDHPKREIKNASQHFRVFNWKYYNLKLNDRDIEELYLRYRCKLVHNAAIPPHRRIELGENEGPILKWNTDDRGNAYSVLHLMALFTITKQAVDRFIPDIDNVLSTSKAAKEFRAEGEHPLTPGPTSGPMRVTQPPQEHEGIDDCPGIPSTGIMEFPRSENGGRC